MMLAVILTNAAIIIIIIIDLCDLLLSLFSLSDASTPAQSRNN